MAGTGGSAWREGKGSMVGDRDRHIAAMMRRPLAAQHFRKRTFPSRCWSATARDSRPSAAADDLTGSTRARMTAGPRKPPFTSRWLQRPERVGKRHPSPLSSSNVPPPSHTCGRRYRAYAASSAVSSGCLIIKRNRHSTAPDGAKRPCSQSRRVATGVPMRSANAA